MDVVYSHVCGLDVHKKTVVACILTPDEKEIRTFSTMTDDLLQMVDWIKSKGCTHAAMESTGSYWKPVYNSCWRRNRFKPWSTLSISSTSPDVKPM